MNLVQGQSLATIDKERRIGVALSIGMHIASVKFAGRGFRYWHLDANCGSGWNDEIGVDGTPLVFWQTARAWLDGLEPAAFFCDHNLVATKELWQRLGSDRDKSVLLPGDNEEAIEVFAECIRRSGEKPQFAVGSNLIDPNGYFYRNQNGEGAPVRAIKWFSREFPRIDIVLNLNIRTYQLQKSQGHAVEPPLAVLQSLGKAYWLIGQTNIGSTRFLLAIGRNVPTGNHRALGLHHLESPEGQWIMNLAEGKRQHELPDLSRISAAPGVSRGARGGNETRRRAMSGLRRNGNGSSPYPISPVGDVRRPIKPETPLPQMSLFGGGEG